MNGLATFSLLFDVYLMDTRSALYLHSTQGQVLTVGFVNGYEVIKFNLGVKY